MYVSKALVIAMMVIGVFLNERVAEGQCTKDCEVRARTEAGWVCGRVRRAEDGSPYASFRGVPYAKPPLGERRFKELEPPESWHGSLDASEDSAVCPQMDFIYNRIPRQLRGMSEDCMYLNIHVPYNAMPTNVTEKPGLPVFVFVHGGGFQAGSGLTDLHGPEYFMTKQVIVITFNYRVGLMGFLSLGTEKIPGNQSLRDIVTLLRWVQRNVQSFGGDPGQVTLMGHSSGAACAHLVSLSLPARGLIHRVILMSGTAVTNFYSPKPSYAKSVATKFLKALGVNSTDPNHVHEKLIAAPLLDIMDAFNTLQLSDKSTSLSMVPVIESEFPNVTRVLDDDPLILIGKGRGKEYPMFIGFTTAEYYFFKWSLLGSDVVNKVRQNPVALIPTRLKYNLPQKAQQNVANNIYQMYTNGTPSLDGIIDSYSDTFFVYPAMKVAQWRSMMAGAPAYLYQFSYEATRSIVKEAIWAKYRGVAHVEDLTYVFRVTSMLEGYVSYPPKNKDDLMRQWMIEAFTNFGKCGNPTCSNHESDWPPLRDGIIQYQDLAEPRVYRLRNLTRKQRERVAMFDSFDDEIRVLESQIKSMKKDQLKT